MFAKNFKATVQFRVKITIVLLFVLIGISVSDDVYAGVGPTGVAVSHFFLEGNFLYVSTYGAGLTVTDTKGTTDSTDDVLVKAYTTTSIPAIGYNNVRHTFLDKNLLYVSTDGGGLSVIDTKGTTSPVDDVLVKTYTTDTEPSIRSYSVRSATMSGNILYVSTGAGLSVIDTKGTVKATDDKLIKTYTTGTTPALGSNFVLHTFLDKNLLYVSTDGGGLSVIDTKGTVKATDDKLIKTYTTGTTPALGKNSIMHTSLVNNLLYVSTLGGGLTVIDTKGTVKATDDKLIKTYTIDTTPDVKDGYVFHSLLNNKKIYVSTNKGVSVIDTKGTVKATDDKLIKTYTIGTIPAIQGNSVRQTLINNNTLYIATDKGISLVSI